MLEYMERVVGYAPHTARERLRVAGALEGLPRLKSALATGVLHFSAVKELTRIAEAQTEEQWISAVENKTIREVEELVAFRNKGERPSDPQHPVARRHAMQFVDLKPETVAMLRLARKCLQGELGGRCFEDDDFLAMLARIVLDPQRRLRCAPVADGDGASSIEVIDLTDVTALESSMAGLASEDAEPEALTPDGDERSRSEPAAIPQDNTNKRLVTPPAHQIALFTCKSCKVSFQNGAGASFAIDDTALVRAKCDAVDIGDIEAPIMARATQTVTPRKRQQVFARDQYRCCIPGCRASFGLDIHHIEPQSLGGSHELWNLTLLCGAHHGQVHDGLLSITGSAPDGLQIRWRDLERALALVEPASHVGRRR